MLSKSKLSLLRSLQQKKFRQETGSFIAEGEKLVSELLLSDFEVKSLFATAEWLKANKLLAAHARETEVVTIDELVKISSLVNPQQVLAVAAIPSYVLPTSYLLKNYCLLLDGIRDPGNLGTMIRIADWFGIRHIICSPDTAEVWNPKVVQASMGSLLRVQLHAMEIGDFFAVLKNAADTEKLKLPTVYGTFLEGHSIYETNFHQAGIIVIGNEANGIRSATEKFITDKVNIPAWKGDTTNEKGPESLNAAVATAIVCAEMRRQLA